MTEQKKAKASEIENEFIWKVLDSEPTSLEKQWRTDVAVDESVLF